MKRALISVLVAVLCLTTPGHGAAASPLIDDTVHIIADGYYLGFDVAPVLEQGRVLVPWRWLAEFYGFRVQFSPEDQSVRATGQDHTVVIQIGHRAASVDGTPVQLAVAPRIVDGRTLVPVCFLADALGDQVRWDAATRTVYITGGKSRPETIPPLALDEIQRVKHGAARFDANQYVVYTNGLSGDTAVLARVVTAWQGAMPAVDPQLMYPAPPYGTSVVIERQAGVALALLAWVCHDHPDGTRTCSNNDDGFVYLWLELRKEPLLVYAPDLATFIRSYPVVRNP